MSNTSKRKPFQKKPSQKGRKSMRGVPEMYDERKEPTTLSLTPTARRGLDAFGESLSISRSELVERIGRGLIPIAVTKFAETKSGRSDTV